MIFFFQQAGIKLRIKKVERGYTDQQVVLPLIGEYILKSFLFFCFFSLLSIRGIYQLFY